MSIRRSPLVSRELNSPTELSLDSNFQFYNGTPEHSFNDKENDRAAASPVATPSGAPSLLKQAFVNRRTILEDNAVAQTPEDDHFPHMRILSQRNNDQRGAIPSPSRGQSPSKSALSPSKCTPQSPSKSRGKVAFSPQPSTVSFSRASSPSKLRQTKEASLLLHRRKSPDSSLDLDEWVEDNDDDSSVRSLLFYKTSTPSETSRRQLQGSSKKYQHYGQHYGQQYDQGPDQSQSRNSYRPTRHFLADPIMPYVVSRYLQILFNFVIVSMMLYYFYGMVQTIRRDVDHKVEEYSTEVLAEIGLCSKEYIRNNCMPGKRVPALETICNSWEKCMNRDPAIVGRARVGAETFADIINGFLDPISFKSMLFLFSSVMGAFFATNMGFSYYSGRLDGPAAAAAAAAAAASREVPRDTPRSYNHTEDSSAEYATATTLYHTPKSTGSFRVRPKSSSKKLRRRSP